MVVAKEIKRKREERERLVVMSLYDENEEKERDDLLFSTPNERRCRQNDD